MAASCRWQPGWKICQTRLEEDLKRFFNPNSERTRRIFIEYFDTDITKEWVWDNYDSSASKKALDALVAKRGDAAHKANTAIHASAEPHKVKREELEKGVRFLKGLVAATEKAKITKWNLLMHLLGAAPDAFLHSAWLMNFFRPVVASRR